MKIKKLFFIVSVLYFIGHAAHAQTAKHKIYDYITIIAEAYLPDVIYISNGEKYEEIKFKKPEGIHDCNEVIKIIKKYEREGYELHSSNSTANPTYLYFLLRREHKE